MVDFKEGNEGWGGDLDENGCFIEGKRVKSSKLLSKTDHWSLLLRSFEGMGAIFIFMVLAVEIGFYLDREFRSAGIQF